MISSYLPQRYILGVYGFVGSQATDFVTQHCTNLSDFLSLFIVA